MCGITGAVWFDPSLAVDRGTLERMTTVLTHRGPDDEGFHIEEMRSRAGYPTIPGVALGFRRLSIIDLAGGHQPIANEDGSCWVILNGEIYNYLELRRRLDTSGHVLRTRTDTEVIVHLYEDLGLDFVQHLVGMFAIAIWDGRRGRLVLARDRLGQKPLIYRHDTSRLLFASELKSLLQVRGIPRRLDPSALDAFLLYQYVPHPLSILEGFRKLPPAHIAVYEDDRLTISRYWEPDWNKESGLSYASARDAVREAAEESIRLRMRSDVPVGVFLSGGIDSTIVAGLAAKQAESPVASFSIGFSEAEFDESHVARNTADRLGTAHHEFRVEPNALEILPRLAWQFDEPFGDSSAVPTWYVAQLAREHVKVALSGDGGDELFAGYDRYRAVRLAQQIDRLPGPLKKLISHPCWQHLPSGTRQKSPVRRWKRFVEALRLPDERRYLEWIAIFHEAPRGRLYSVDFVAQLARQDPAAFVEGAFSLSPQRDPLTRTSIADLVTYLPCDLMTKVDMATMAHGLECRQPFLDHRLVELAMSLPIDFKIQGREAKWVLKEAFADLIPSQVRRRPKMGFGVPVDRWFRHELRDFTRDALLDSRATSRGYFQPRAVEALMTEHLSGHFNHGYRLWALLMLELWCRQWLDRAPRT